MSIWSELVLFQVKLVGLRYRPHPECYAGTVRQAPYCRGIVEFCAVTDVDMWMCSLVLCWVSE